MTKFLTKAVLAATVATGLFASPALAADTERFTATARIVSPLTLTKNADLNFGTITMLSGLTSSDVTVGQDSTGDACGANLACTTPSPASFDVAGSVNQGVTITLDMPANPGLLVNGAASVAFAADAPASVLLDSLGEASFTIGGTITVTSATTDGTYSNDIDVTVEYS